MLVRTEQHSDGTNCHSHHYTHCSLIFNDNRVPAYCVGVHQIIYLIFIWNIFALCDVGRKDPELL